MADQSIFGARGKRVDPTIIGMIMRMDFRALEKAKCTEQKTEKFLLKDLQEHNLEHIQKDFDDINAALERGKNKGYGVAFRDLLMLKAAIIALRHANELSQEHLTNTLKDAKELANITKPSKLLKEIEKIEHACKDAKDYTAKEVAALIEEAHKELQSEQKLDFEIQREKVHGEDLALLFKSEHSNRFIDQWIARGDISDVRRDLHRIYRDQSALEKSLFDDIFKRIDEFKKVVEQHKENPREAPQKTLGTIQYHIKQFLEEIHDLLNRARDLVKKTYRVFLKTFIIMHLFKQEIELMLKDNQDEQVAIGKKMSPSIKKLIQNHEIPQAMGLAEIHKLEELNQRLHLELKNIERVLLQLWNL